MWPKDPKARSEPRDAPRTLWASLICELHWNLMHPARSPSILRALRWCIGICSDVICFQSGLGMILSSSYHLLTRRCRRNEAVDDLAGDKHC
jgi:hypothetical protein